MYDNDDFRHNPEFSFLMENVHYETTLFEEDDFTVKQTGSNSVVKILLAILGAAFIGWILLCIYLWFWLP